VGRPVFSLNHPFSPLSGLSGEGSHLPPVATLQIKDLWPVSHPAEKKYVRVRLPASILAPPILTASIFNSIQIAARIVMMGG
jgi:hypothetical protein